jgi:mono/diheme cytochrome c family protein
MQQLLKQNLFTVGGVFALALAIGSLVSFGSQNAVSAPNGEEAFKASCAACHAAGGNIVNPKKPVKGSPKLASKEAFKAYLLKPSGSMMPYPQIANDAATLDALYTYCKALK